MLPSASRRRSVALAGLLSFLALLPTTAGADDGLGAGSAGILAEGAALRTTPGFDAPAVTEVAFGTDVTVTDGPLTAADGSLWYQVDVWGQIGFLPTSVVSGTAGDAGSMETFDATAPVETVDETAAMPEDLGSTEAFETEVPVDSTDVSGDAFAAFETTETAIEPPAPTALTAPTAPTAPTGTVFITGTDGDGAACRGEASYGAPSLATLPEGSVVDALGGAVGEWQPVACGGGTGYINGAYVSWETVDAAPTTTDVTADQAVTEPAAPAEAAAAPAEVAAAPETTEVPMIAAPVAAAEPVAVEPVAFEAAPVAAPSGGGQAIADFAMGFVGYPYVYAGASPAGFDCSGFTMYVVQQTLGMSIPHDTAAQSGVGTPVGKDELQPGDLVFFQNTFAPGVSHSGVYIGGGQFVHAENEATGVKVSDVNSSYYSEHWYGAKRLV